MDALLDRAGEWWSKDTIALVTGANQGIGLQLVRELAKRGLTTIITSRDESKGLKSQESLQKEGLPGELLVYHQLDITSPKSVEELALWISRSYGGIDILINNAAIAPDVANVEQAKHILDTNYYSTKRMIEAMVPYIKPGGRIINMSAKAGDLCYLHNDWKTKLEDISTLTPGNIDEMIQDFLRAVESNEIQAKGWPCLGAELPSAPRPEMLAEYSLSKVALNAYTRLIAGELASNKQIFINSMCPGVTNTSLSRFRGHPVEIGADTAVFLALLPPGTPEAPMPHGKFFVNRRDVGFSQIPLFANGKTYANIKELYADNNRDN